MSSRPQQIKISGNPEINGYIIAGDGKPTWTGDPFTSSSDGVSLNEFSGNPLITYARDFSCSGPGCLASKFSMTGWPRNNHGLFRNKILHLITHRVDNREARPHVLHRLVI